METKIFLENQNKLVINGISKVKSVTPTEILGEMNEETLIITGQNLEVQNLDIDSSCLHVQGIVTGIKFAPQKQGFLKKIFR